MRLSIIALAITGLMFAPGLSNAQESLPLKTQMDANIQLILESLMTSLVGKTQVTSETTQVTVSPNSQMAQGLIITEVSTPAASSALNGNIAMQLSQQASDVILEVQIEVAVSNDVFFKTMGERIGTSSTITDLVGLKSALSEVVANLQPQAQRPRQTFGTPSPRSTTGGSGMSQESVDLLNQVLSQAMKIETVDGSQTITLDLEMTKTLLSSSTELADVSKHINNFESLRMTMNTDSVSIYLVSKIIIPLQAAEAYDQYLSQLQVDNPERLSEVSLLISKFGPWAIGRCMHEKYQSVCVEKLLSSCVKNNSSLESCISLAENLQSAREARNEGDYLGVVTNGAEAAAKSAFQSIEDWMAPEEEE